jgi:hypothetical protein
MKLFLEFSLDADRCVRAVFVQVISGGVITLGLFYWLRQFASHESTPAADPF